MSDIKLLEPEQQFIDKSVRRLLDLALCHDITREKYEDVLKAVFVKGYTVGYGDGYYDGGKDACADERGDFYNIENERCRF